MDVDTLAALAANTVVAAAVTDAFEEFRTRVARLFGRGHPDSGTARRLDTTRQQLAASTGEDLERAGAAQARQWETRFADLLADRPETAGALQSLLAEFRSLRPDAGGNVTNTISGTIHNGPVLMGRDFGDITVGSPDGQTRPGTPGP
jgi:hypothetical protein